VVEVDKLTVAIEPVYLPLVSAFAWIVVVEPDARLAPIGDRSNGLVLVCRFKLKLRT
jgi:hypothetical protein